MQVIASSGTVVEGDATLECLKVSPRWPEARAAYFCSSRTGLMTAPGVNSHCWLFQWFHPTICVRLQMLRVRGLLTTPPTTPQEWALRALMMRMITNSAGTAGIDPTQAGGLRKWINYPFSAFNRVSGSGGLIAVSATGSITPPTGITDTSEFASDAAWELAAGAAVPRSRVCFEKDYGTGAPIILGGRDMWGEAILIQLPVAIGAAGVLRVAVDVAWDEVDACKV